MNKKNIWWIIITIVFLLVVISAILNQRAFAGFLGTAITLLEAYNAFKEPKGLKPFNPLKGYYRSKNKLEKYRKIMLVFAILFFVFGISIWVAG